MRRLLNIFILSFSLGLLLISFIAYAKQTSITNYYPSPSGNYTKVQLVNNSGASIACTGSNAGTIYANPTTGYLEICKNDSSVASYPGSCFNRFAGSVAAMPNPACPNGYQMVNENTSTNLGSSSIVSWSCCFTGQGQGANSSENNNVASSGCFSIYSNSPTQPTACTSQNPNAYDVGCDTINSTDMSVPVFKRNCCFNNTLGQYPLSTIENGTITNSASSVSVCTCPNTCGADNCSSDSCGHSCGTCPPEGSPTFTTCSSTTAGTPGSCICTPTTCAMIGDNCGTPSNGCSGTLPSCGVCTGMGQSCGGGGTPFHCGCTSTGCAAASTVACGTAYTDNCGTSCGTGTLCTLPQTCGGGGTAGVCGCTSTGCAAASSIACGTSYADNCGTSCGSGTKCTAPDTCNSGACSCISTGCLAATTVACGIPYTDNCGTTSCGSGTKCTSPNTCNSGSCSCVSVCPAPSTVTCGASYLDNCGNSCGTGTQCPVSQNCVGNACQCAPSCPNGSVDVPGYTCCPAGPGDGSDGCGGICCGNGSPNGDCCNPGCQEGYVCSNNQCVLGSCTDPTPCGTYPSCTALDACGICGTTSSCASNCCNGDSCIASGPCTSGSSCSSGTCGACTPTPTCFISGTKVLLADGKEKNIEEIKKGDLVLGSDKSINKVTATIVHDGDSFVLYSINDGPYFVTASHPFMTTMGWKSFDPKETKITNPQLKVSALSVGDQLVTLKGTIRLNHIQSRDTKIKHVYNLTVEGAHDYYADDYLVHNKNACPNGSASVAADISCTCGATICGDCATGFTCCTGSQSCVLNTCTLPACTAAQDNSGSPNPAWGCGTSHSLAPPCQYGSLCPVNSTCTQSSPPTGNWACVPNGCIPDCSCAASTCTGSSCTDSVCGTTCSGTLPPTNGTCTAWSACSVGCGTGTQTCTASSAPACGGASAVGTTQACSPTCAGGSCCGNTCVNESSDTNNCGSCGNSCNGCSCSGGACVKKDACGICGGTVVAQYTQTSQQCVPDVDCPNPCSCGFNSPTIAQVSSCTPSNAGLSCGGDQANNCSGVGPFNQVTCNSNCGSDCGGTVGCDGVCNSGKVDDVCGVCGGNGSECCHNSCTSGQTCVGGTCIAGGGCTNGPAGNLPPSATCCSGPALAQCGSSYFCAGPGPNPLQCCCENCVGPDQFWVTNNPSCAASGLCGQSTSGSGC